MKSSNFRLLLQDEFETRCQRNKKYSLRAFAQSLGVHNGALSEMLRGKRKISKKSIKKMGNALKLNPSLLQKFLDQYDQQIASSKKQVEDLSLRPITYPQVSIDDYHYISNELHDIILSCIKLKGFMGDLNWIAKLAGVSLMEVEICVERLKRLNYLDITKDGKWKDIKKKGIIRPAKNRLIDKAYEKWLKKHLKQVAQNRENPKPGTYNLTHILPVSFKDIEEIQRMMDKFSGKLDRYAEKSKNSYDQVLQYHFLLLPLIES